MATHKQAEKRHRQSLKRRTRNMNVKSTLRTAVKKLRQSIASGNSKEAKTLLQETQSILARAASKRIIPKTRASRLVARLSVSVQNLKA